MAFLWYLIAIIVGSIINSAIQVFGHISDPLIKTILDFVFAALELLTGHFLNKYWVENHQEKKNAENEEAKSEKTEKKTEVASSEAVSREELISQGGIEESENQDEEKRDDSVICYCRYCGAKVELFSIYCHICGKRIRGEKQK